MKILVVDDAQVQRDVVSHLIEAAGHEVISASGGEAAVAVAAATDLDLVLMDVRMPGVDGLEAARRIRALDGARGRVPIVAMSAAPFTSLACRDAGMDGFVSKAGLTLNAVVEAVAAGSRHEPDPAEASRMNPDDSFRIPRGLALTVLLTLPAMIGSGAWYMASQAAEAHRLAAVQTMERADMAQRQAAQDAANRQNSDELIRLERTLGESIGRIDLRLTRMEERMGFLLDGRQKTGP
jgi:CheY-like chemotaxis protein